MNVTGIPVSVEVTWEKPYKEGSLFKAEVSVSIIELDEISRTSKEVEISG